MFRARKQKEFIIMRLRVKNVSWNYQLKHILHKCISYVFLKVLYIHCSSQVCEVGKADIISLNLDRDPGKLKKLVPYFQDHWWQIQDLNPALILCKHVESLKSEIDVKMLSKCTLPLSQIINGAHIRYPIGPLPSSVR